MEVPWSEIFSNLVFGVWVRKPKVRAMSAKKASWASLCTGIARMILHNRQMRRKMLLQLVIVLLVLVVLGAWPLAGWLSGNIWLFLLWWAASVFYGLVVILFALYDMLAVFKEER